MEKWGKRFWALIQLSAAVAGGSVCVHIVTASPSHTKPQPTAPAHVAPSECPPAKTYTPAPTWTAPAKEVPPSCESRPAPKVQTGCGGR